MVLAEQDSPSPLPRHGLDLDFRSFAQQPEYRGVNNRLIAKVFQYLPDGFVQIDVATGTGLVPQETIKIAEQIGRYGRIIGIDPNLVSLAHAQQDTRKSPFVTVEFVDGYGQDVADLVAGKIPPEGVDWVSIHDAIHEVHGQEQKDAVLAAMVSVLKPGGVLSLNSAFTTATYDDVLWGKWKLAAMNRLGVDRPKRKDRIHEDKDPGMEILSPEAYDAMVEKHGMRIIYRRTEPVALRKKPTLADISLYGPFIAGALAGMVIKEGRTPPTLREQSNALIRGLDDIPGIVLRRGWYSLIAEKLS